MIGKLVDEEFDGIYGEEVVTYSRYYPVSFLEVMNKEMKETRPSYCTQLYML
jgi:hypothetical protein